MNSPILSIVVPIYNAEEYLENCIESILTQNDSIYELLLIDNGSTDSSKKICDSYATQHKNIKAYHIPNNGVSNARNFGINHASGKWIAFIDSDDFINSEYIKTIKPFLNQDIELITFNYIRYINAHKEEKGSLTIQEGLHKTSIDLFNLAIRLEVAALSVWSSIYKNEIIQKYNLRFREDMKTCEDFMFSLSYYNYVNKFYIINKGLYYYRQNPTSTTRIRDLQHAKNYQTVFNAISELIRTKHISLSSIYIFQNRWTRWIIDLIYNYKSQKIKDQIINKSVYSQPFYADIMLFKSRNPKFRFERFLLRYKLNTTILFYCRIVGYLKILLKKYKL